MSRAGRCRTNCGSPSDVIQLQKISVSPVPVIFGKNVTLSGAGFLTQAIDSSTVRHPFACSGAARALLWILASLAVVEPTHFLMVHGDGKVARELQVRPSALAPTTPNADRHLLAIFLATIPDNLSILCRT